MRRDPTPFALPELAQSVTSLPGVGPATAAALARREIRTWGDLLFFFPLRYEDRRRPTPIAELAAGERVVAAGTIAQAGTWGRQGRGYRMILRDGTGELPLLWFRPMKGRLGEFQKGEQVLAVGAVEDNREGGLMMAHPSLYRAEEAEGHPALGRVVPIYPALEGAPAGRVQRFMADLVERVAPALPDPLAGVLPRELYPLAASQALTQAHLPPEPPAEDPPWRQALAVGELFYYELGLMLRRRQRRQAPGRALAPPGRLIGRLLQSLPFKLTQGQVEAVEAIRSDLARDWPMGRLLAGDVGTGKTVVAAAAACLAAEAGVQTALMAPTEVLARQHHATLSGLLEPLGLAVALAIGGQNGPQRQAAREAAGRAQVVVGTHALIAEGMEFRDLGLAIIDEQHRFGVEQRLSLAGKGAEPHLLVLSATPIPRTLALALAGHLEISDLPERPGARPPVATEVVAFEERRLALEASTRLQMT